MFSIKFYIKVKSFFDRVFKDESGMGTIEVIIIIAVLVSLALVFRNFIMDRGFGICFGQERSIFLLHVVQRAFEAAFERYCTG